MKLQLSLFLLCAAPSLVVPALAQEAEQVAPANLPHEQALDRAYEKGEAGEWEAARAEFGKALDAATSPDEKAYVYGQIGATYEVQGNHAQSQIQFRKVMEVPGVAVGQRRLAHLALASSLRGGKNFAEAGKEADLILADAAYELDVVERMAALSIRGDAHLEAREWAAARKNFDEILQLRVAEEEASPITEYSRAAAQMNLGKAYLGEDKPDEARTQLRALQRDLSKLPPEEALTGFIGWSVQQLIARSYREEKDVANARVELEKLLTMPNLPAEIKTQAQSDLAALEIGEMK